MGWMSGSQFNKLFTSNEGVNKGQEINMPNNTQQDELE